MPPVNHRLFFALWPPGDVQLAIEERTRAHVASAGGKPVPARNYHATLAFLGSVSRARLPLVQALASDVCAPEFTLMLDHVNAWRGSRVLFLGSQACPSALLDLAKALQTALRAHDFALEDRPFRLHVTLAREVSVSHEARIDPIAWKVRDFALVESTLSHAGSRYDAVAGWPLRAD